MMDNLQHIINRYNDGWTSRQIAEEMEFTASGVRGMLSRARQQGLVGDRPGEEYVSYGPSVGRQMEVVERGKQMFDSHLYKISKRSEKTGELAKMMFISDVHLPLQDERCISLIEQLLKDFQPDIATAMNDWFDFTEYSRWEDLRPGWARLWTDDIQNAINLSADVRRVWLNASPDTEWPALLGNHDKWMWVYFLKYFSGGSDKLLAHVMEELEDQGILFLSNGEQNTIQLSPALKLTHGTKASSNRGSVAKAILKAHADKSYHYENRVYNVFYGHDHREVVFEENGVVAFGTGCNMVPDPPYMVDDPDWDQGVGVAYYDPNGNYVKGELVSFRPNRKNQLQAVFEGKVYTSSV